MVHGGDLSYSNFRVIGGGVRRQHALTSVPVRPIGLTWGRENRPPDEIRSDASLLPGSYLGNRAAQRHGAKLEMDRGEMGISNGVHCAVHGAARATCRVGSLKRVLLANVLNLSVIGSTVL